ncbi:MAG: RNA-directed DNA polymerase [Bacteroidales bacterium]|jgi:retron-type reverse transcriptase|nr:RNA-directed DNA polymerase [Bacteroidales bacterium]
MKRYGYLFDSIISPDNLRLAFYKAQKGKSAKPDVMEFRRDLDRNLLRLHDSLADGSYRVGNYHYFRVYDPKERLICAAAFAERVIHHAIMNVCDPLFERHQVPFSYACRRDKGVFAALEQARRNQCRYSWFLKLDVRKYFDSIDHAVLLGLLRRLFKDERLLALLWHIIDSYHVAPGKGNPIGNLTSQYFANYYLSPADKYAVHTLQIPAYIRYMDDMLLWADSKEELQAKGLQLEKYIDEKLSLALKPFVMNRTSHGLPALGFLVYPHQIRLNRRSRTRYAAKMRNYWCLLESGDITEKEFSINALALQAFIAHANSRGFARRVNASFQQD